MYMNFGETPIVRSSASEDSRTSAKGRREQGVGSLSTGDDRAVPAATAVVGGLQLNLTVISQLKHARCEFWDAFEAAHHWPGRR
jgi:hypothetical protein